MPATGALIGTPASMSDSVDPQTDAIDVEPFDASTSETTRMRVRPLVGRREHRHDRPLGERAVADLAALRRADPAGLAGRERREVVVVHVPLAIVDADRVEHLLHARHAEGDDRQHLRLAPLEQARAVRRRDDPDLGRRAGGGRRCHGRRCARPRRRCGCARPASGASGTPCSAPLLCRRTRPARSSLPTRLATTADSISSRRLLRSFLSAIGHRLATSPRMASLSDRVERRRAGSRSRGVVLDLRRSDRAPLAASRPARAGGRPTRGSTPSRPRVPR